MKNKIFEVYFDCGLSKIRASVFNKDSSKNNLYYESNFFFDHSHLEAEIQKIISLIEKDNKEYLDEINLMIDSPKMLSVGISISKKLDGSKLQKKDIQFLIQDVKQQVLRNYSEQNIIHIIVKSYKIDGRAYTYLPDGMDCKLISLDILFICMPKEIIEYYKKIFFNSDISVNQILCTSYAKSESYKGNFSLIENLSFIDIGFNKTSITCYIKNQIFFLDILPVGGNHVTKDISKVLKIGLQDAEKIKISFDKDRDFLDKQKISPNLIQQVIFARIEEILELSAKSIKLNLNLTALEQCKMILTGEGSKLLSNKFKEKISISYDIDLLDETVEDIFQLASKIAYGSNKQEVVTVPKKQKKQGFFEKLFHFFL